MLAKYSEIVAAVSHVLHVSKPLLVELVLFIWAFVEMAKFIWSVAFGHPVG